MIVRKKIMKILLLLNSINIDAWQPWIVQRILIKSIVCFCKIVHNQIMMFPTKHSTLCILLTSVMEHTTVLWVMMRFFCGVQQCAMHCRCQAMLYVIFASIPFYARDLLYVNITYNQNISSLNGLQILTRSKVKIFAHNHINQTLYYKKRKQIFLFDELLEFSVFWIEYPLGGSSKKGSHVYFLVQVFWVILLFCEIVQMLIWCHNNIIWHHNSSTIATIIRNFLIYLTTLLSKSLTNISVYVTSYK